MTVALETKGLEKSFGDLRAVDGVSFHVAPGEIVGLLGPNGADRIIRRKLATLGLRERFIK